MTKQSYTMFIDTIWSKIEALVYDYKPIWKSALTHFTPYFWQRVEFLPVNLFFEIFDFADFWELASAILKNLQSQKSQNT